MAMREPATPLPWTRNDHYIFNDEFREKRSALRVHDPLDADYAVHTANAYPKLVGFVRSFADDAWLLPPRIADAARALLAEIGEA